MKNPLLYLLLPVMFISCTKKLSEQDQFFIDYAETEDCYNHFGKQDYWNLYDVYDENSELLEEKQDINDYVNDVKNRTSLNYANSLVYSGKIPYPYELTFHRLSDSLCNVDVKVFIPDQTHSLLLSKKNIGKENICDSLKIKLLKIHGNCAILTIEDLTKRYDYSYTYGISRDKDNEEEDNSDNEAKLMPHSSPFGYKKDINYENIHGSAFAAQTILSDSSLKSQPLKFTCDVISKRGKKIISDIFGENFRHYLWYRNMDMPYESMVCDFASLKMRYKEEDTDPDYMYHPIYTIFIRSYGDIEKVNIKLRSEKGKILTANTGNFNPVKNSEKLQIENDEKIKKSIQNLTEKEIKNAIKIYQNNQGYVKGQSKYIFLYASMPQNYNTQNNSIFRMRFNDPIYLLTDKGDSIKVTDFNTEYQPNQIMNIYTQKHVNTIEKVSFERPSFPIVKAIGSIYMEYPNYTDSIYEINHLPECIKYDAVDNSLVLDGIDFYYNQSVENMFGYDANGQMIPYNNDQIYFGSKHIYSGNLKKVVLMYQNTLVVDIPFEISLK